MLTAVDPRTVVYQVQQPPPDINQPGPSGIVTRKQVAVQPVSLPGHLEGYQRDFNLQFLGPQGSWAQEMEEVQSTTECSESSSSEDPPIQLEASSGNVTTGPVYQPVSPAIVVTQVPHAQPTTTTSNVVNSGAITVQNSSNIPAYQTMHGYVKASDPSSPPQLSKAHLKKKARHAKEKKVAEHFGPNA
jgi:hypothetical protein